MRFIIHFKIQCIPNLEPLKIYNKYHKLKNEIFKEKIKYNDCVQIDHIINHMFLANHSKIQMIICNFK